MELVDDGAYVISLDFVDFVLDIVKTPLLTFLHLDHHLFNLLELIEIVLLHLVQLFLLVGHYFLHILSWLISLLT
jgi:hypothetical protein